MRRPPPAAPSSPPRPVAHSTPSISPLTRAARTCTASLGYTFLWSAADAQKNKALGTKCPQHKGPLDLANFVSIHDEERDLVNWVANLHARSGTQIFTVLEQADYIDSEG